MSAAEPTAPASALQFSPVTKLRFEWHADKMQSDKNGDQWLPSSDGSIVGVSPSGPPAPPAGYRRIQLRDGDPNTAALSASWARLLEEGFPDCAWTTEKIESSFRSAPTWNPSAVVLAEHVHAPGEVVAAGMAWVDTVGDEWGRVSRYCFVGSKGTLHSVLTSICGICFSSCPFTYAAAA